MLTDFRVSTGFRVAIASFALSLTLGLSGCTVSTHHSDDKQNKGNDNVDVRTPFGSFSVHQGNTDAKDTGLSPYPGAQLMKSTGHDGDSSANVNISSPFFALKVVALKYSTTDSPDKVLGFYRKDLSKYGKVVDCTGGFNMDFHPRDKSNGGAEVSCDSDKKGDGEYKEELKVGTENSQRIVAVKSVGDSTEFALVYVRAHGDKDKDTM